MKIMKTRNYNIDAAFKVVVLLGFALFFFLTIQSGQVLKYVHPRNVPFIKFAVIAMVLISIFFIPEVFKPQRIKVSSIPLLFFILPLIMAFLLPTQSFNSDYISYGDLKLQGNSGNVDNPEIKTEYSEEDEYNEDIYIDEYSDAENKNIIESNRNELQLIDETIIMDNDNYVRWIQEIYENIEKYNGKKIQVSGFVFKDEQFEDNEFVSARMMMVCCAADMQPIGFLCRYDNAAELKVDTWIRVYGTIEKGEFNGNVIPVIEADKVENTEKPEFDYVYPF
ncbi:TIGR03943 family putative permease subunit [Sporanaerobacter acetigenes]|uniref:Putative membrane protein n=1 Tax=Sporanaerobacter acetigenes DSM 13106 TaxID=1123281 RepID=A0A1M5Z6F9_9FIRM|nr:TIGR03943 family protein [Sporanaerobacter acetigenes]SHI19847.1 putative membrane protein [Sporanaerobacter acetigenes DSM 13106]